MVSRLMNKFPTLTHENSFVEDFMSVASEHQKCSAFADYLTDTYIAEPGIVVSSSSVEGNSIQHEKNQQ